MKEFLYTPHQRTGEAPKIRKLGAVRLGMEQTPILFRGEPLIAESMAPDDVCPHQYIRVRNLKTGAVTAPFGQEYFFASAFCEGDKLCVFATSRLDDKPFITANESEDASKWYDPRGGHTVRMFQTRDLENWIEKDVVTCPGRRLWNTSVCRGENGYVMAIEVRGMDGVPDPAVGVGFTTFFAESDDLENWTMMPDDHAYTPERYNACPALRYSGGWYYMICLEALPCARYASYIYRTKDFLNWEVGFHNPILMWSDEDRVPKEGCHFTPEELDLLEHGLNINCSDIDLLEFDGQTHIYYATGDQLSYSFLCEAVYDGTMDEFLEAFFQ